MNIPQPEKVDPILMMGDAVEASQQQACPDGDSVRTNGPSAGTLTDLAQASSKPRTFANASGLTTRQCRSTWLVPPGVVFA